ncbi:hypothetical protein [uncultured Legionella sp.]|uniref:hypothetical protein n=1 Tax=uncultured Legionella sp. TaxID=210934 RepID=UPI00262A3AD5|nr:hypothetical protein [uncultured Legionella sp.]
MTNIVIYTDFDGTVTGKVGKNAVFSPFYQSLLVGYTEGKVQDYKNTPMKPNGDIQELFENKFGLFSHGFDYSQEDTSFLMSADAVLFFHDLLKSERVSINIVTKNRADYISALFKYQGFSAEEIQKITILDSGLKYQDVTEHLNSLKERASYLYILDDDGLSDYPDMVLAAQHNLYNEQQIRGYNELPGQFNWQTYHQDILNLLAIKEEHTAEIELPRPTPITPYESEIDDEPSATNAADYAAINSETTERELSGSADKATVSQASSYSNTNIATISALVGSSIGFATGMLLVLTGLFTPFGTGLLGVLALGGTFAASTGLLAGLGGYITALATAPDPIPQTKNKTDAPMQENNKGTMPNHAPPKHVSDVAHFPHLFANTGETTTTAPPENSLDDVSNTPRK